MIKFSLYELSSKSLLFSKDKPKPIILDIENWFISSGLYENSLIAKLFTGEIKATSVFKLLPINLSRFLCWLFLPDKNIFPFLSRSYLSKKSLNDWFISLNKTLTSSFDRAW